MPPLDLISAAGQCGENAQRAVALVAEHGAALALPASGHTAQRWEVLSAVARVNLTVARVLEAHSDALAILAEADVLTVPSGSWGVFAAESPTDRLEATVAGDGTARLTGVKPWCSLASILDHALVTAHTDQGRRLFHVDLHHPGIEVAPARGWVARGLRTIPSTSVNFDSVRAEPVGDTGWYLTRPGFAWGGMGVAACWFGGALGLADSLNAHARTRPGDLMSMHVGDVDRALFAARCALQHAAREIDDGRADAQAGAALALRVRAVVADTTEHVLRSVGHALGPAPLAFDAEHAARVADLGIYVRQHHGERDLAALGAHLMKDDR